MIRSPNGNAEFFDIVTGVLQGDILALFMFIISPDYVLRKSLHLIKENSFILKKARSGNWNDSKKRKEEVVRQLLERLH